MINMFGLIKCFVRYSCFVIKSIQVTLSSEWTLSAPHLSQNMNIWQRLNAVNFGKDQPRWHGKRVRRFGDHFCVSASGTDIIFQHPVALKYITRAVSLPSILQHTFYFIWHQTCIQLTKMSVKVFLKCIYILCLPTYVTPIPYVGDKRESSFRVDVADCPRMFYCLLDSLLTCLYLLLP
jgi:hypothetical protein